VPLIFGFGGSKGTVKMAILASLITRSICGWLISLSITIPRTSSISSNFPPTLPSTLISPVNAAAANLEQDFAEFMGEMKSLGAI